MIKMKKKSILIVFLLIASTSIPLAQGGLGTIKVGEAITGGTLDYNWTEYNDTEWYPYLYDEVLSFHTYRCNISDNEDKFAIADDAETYRGIGMARLNATLGTTYLYGITFNFINTSEFWWAGVYTLGDTPRFGIMNSSSIIANTSDITTEFNGENWSVIKVLYNPFVGHVCLKIWDMTSQEPDEWNLETTNDTFITDSRVQWGLYAWEGTGESMFDWWGVGFFDLHYDTHYCPVLEEYGVPVISATQLSEDTIEDLYGENLSDMIHAWNNFDQQSFFNDSGIAYPNDNIYIYTAWNYTYSVVTFFIYVGIDDANSSSDWVNIFVDKNHNHLLDKGDKTYLVNKSGSYCGKRSLTYNGTAWVEDLVCQVHTARYASAQGELIRYDHTRWMVIVNLTSFLPTSIDSFVYDEDYVGLSIYGDYPAWCWNNWNETGNCTRCSMPNATGGAWNDSIMGGDWNDLQNPFPNETLADNLNCLGDFNLSYWDVTPTFDNGKNTIKVGEFASGGTLDGDWIEHNNTNWLPYNDGTNWAYRAIGNESTKHHYWSIADYDTNYRICQQVEVNTTGNNVTHGFVFNYVNDSCFDVVLYQLFIIVPTFMIFHYNGTELTCYNNVELLDIIFDENASHFNPNNRSIMKMIYNPWEGRIQFKAWDSTRTEPALWQVDVTNPIWSTSNPIIDGTGKCGLFCYVNETTSADFYNYTLMDLTLTMYEGSKSDTPIIYCPQVSSSELDTNLTEINTNSKVSTWNKYCVHSWEREDWTEILTHRSNDTWQVATAWNYNDDEVKFWVFCTTDHWGVESNLDWFTILVDSNHNHILDTGDKAYDVFYNNTGSSWTYNGSAWVEDATNYVESVMYMFNQTCTLYHNATQIWVVSIKASSMYNGTLRNFAENRKVGITLYGESPAWCWNNWNEVSADNRTNHSLATCYEGNASKSTNLTWLGDFDLTGWAYTPPDDDDDDDGSGSSTDDDADTTTVPTETPGFEVLALVISILGCLIVVYYRKK